MIIDRSRLDLMEKLNTKDMSGIVRIGIKVLIKTLTGGTITVYIDEKTTVKELKYIIYFTNGIQQSQQKIIYDRKVLKDHQLLSNQNITPESILFLISTL